MLVNSRNEPAITSSLEFTLVSDTGGKSIICSFPEDISNKKLDCRSSSRDPNWTFQYAMLGVPGGYLSTVHSPCYLYILFLKPDTCF